MEILVATAVGILTASGIYMILRQRTFPVIVGLTMISYATNIFIFAAGRLAIGLPPVLRDEASAYTDPIPQALVLTAIVISFGMSAVIVMFALGAYLNTGSDRINMEDPTFEAGLEGREGGK